MSRVGEPSVLTFIGSRAVPSPVTYLGEVEANDSISYLGGLVDLPLHPSYIGYDSEAISALNYLGHNEINDGWGCILCGIPRASNPSFILWDDGDELVWDDGDEVEWDEE